MKIINKTSKKLPFDLEKEIQKFLKEVPDEHLIGLESITLLDEFSTKRYEDTRGKYFQKNGLKKARIEISIKDLCSYKPYALRILPFLGKFLIAEVLFHEVGHHFRHLTHGVSKRENENFADQYKSKMLYKTFYSWFYFLRPFKSLILRIRKNKNS